MKKETNPSMKNFKLFLNKCEMEEAKKYMKSWLSYSPKNNRAWELLEEYKSVWSDRESIDEVLSGVLAEVEYDALKGRE